MHSIMLAIRSRDKALPVFNTVGYAPTVSCPLAIAKVVEHTKAKGWRDTADGWMIVHISSGYQLGSYVADTQSEALALLVRCDPDFPGWRAVTGHDAGQSAFIACRAKWMAAQVQQQ